MAYSEFDSNNFTEKSSKNLSSKGGRVIGKLKSTDSALIELHRNVFLSVVYIVHCTAFLLKTFLAVSQSYRARDNIKNNLINMESRGGCV